MLKSRITELLFGGRRKRNVRMTWEHRWSHAAFAPPWLDRGISPEIEEAVRTGWLRRDGPILDLGCGEGDVTAWLVGQGYSAMGVDIAAAAVERAYAKHPGLPLDTFQAIDLTIGSLTGSFSSFIDRGCFHGIPLLKAQKYVSNILIMARPSARLLLFIKAFRDETVDPEEEYSAKLEQVARSFGPRFRIERHTRTDLGPVNRPHGSPSLPGLVFWIQKVD